jgi:SAM-dependent methyltransferase
MEAVSLNEATRAHLADSYPHNHDYRVVGSDMRAKWKLARRWRRLRRHWPSDIGSFLDIGCSKGFFVLQAAHRGAAALGIDIHEADLAACEAVREHLGLEDARFQHKTLDELSAEGESFELVHLVNTYHYLYFGSDRGPAIASDHSVIFERLAAVTSGTLIFSNCENFERCPAWIKEHASAEEKADYTPEALRSAASKWFEIEEHKDLGKRPLWVGHRK